MFGHLQVKSCYSFQKSTILIKPLVKMAKAKHIDALALADDDNMYGAFEFFEACRQYAIKPIFGVNASVMIEDEVYPFLLLAKDDVGYFDLIRIVTDINLRKERAIPLSALSVYKEHLYVISASSDSIVERLIAKDMEKEAEKYMRLFKETFGGCYLVMIQHLNIANEEVLNKRLVALAAYLEIKVVAGNDVCYLEKEDALTVDLLQAAREDRKLDPDHQPLTSERYLKDEAEMSALFDRTIIAQTKEVLTTCKASIPTGIKNLPYYPTPHNAPHDEYLKRLCAVGLKKRFKGRTIPHAYKERLLYELSVIDKMGFNDYFLIVYDYVHYAKTHDILVGPGRGSAAGSLVAYVLGITNIDPLKYHLLFERFLNPERVTMPDIDIDFQDDKRDQVVEYVIQKYGQEHVAQIVTFSTYGPRNAIKDLGKVMNIPLARLEYIAKMVPTGYKNRKTISQVYQTSSSFQKAFNENSTLKKLLRPMSVAEYLPRNISMHAAGVVLSTKPLRDSVPLVIGPSDMIMTQYSKDYIEKAGLLKMDFLGLKNLTMIAHIIEDKKRDSGYAIDLNKIPFNDPKTYELLSRADTYGVFQLESNGMRQLLRRMKPRRFMDIVDAIALYRPGPMENIPLYLKNRAHPDQVTYIVPALHPILEETYGIIVYQEQIMQIARVIAGFSLGKADILRKAVSKKNAETMREMKEDFIAGATSQGYSQEIAMKIYDLIEKFANYGFNKSHSVAYGVVAYWLAYLKANEPLYFFASILSNDGASLKTRMHVIEECRKYGVDILGPSVNHSYDRFMVEGHAIRYSMTAIKNVGSAAYRAISAEREENGPFKDLMDFFKRTFKSLSLPVMESLIDAGAFDEFEDNRAMIRHNLSTILEYVRLADDIGVEPPVIRPQNESLWTKLENEKQALGIYLSKHPLALMKDDLRKKEHLHIINICDIDERYVNRSITIVMTIQRVKVIVDRKANQMAFIAGSDDTGEMECTVFSAQYERYSEDPSRPLERNNVVLISVKVQMREHISLVLNSIRKVK